MSGTGERGGRPTRLERWLIPATLRSRLTLAFLTTNVVVVGIAAAALFAVVRSSHPSAAAGPAGGVWGFTLLLALGIAAAAGLTVGLVMTALIRRPLEHLAEAIGRHGHHALEGHAPRPLPDDPYLPAEFRALVEVFDSLLDHLARRQAELLSAERAAEFSARDLAFAVDDSSEAKILLRDDAIVLANPAAATLLGIPQRELLGDPAQAFTRVAVLDEHEEPLEARDLARRALGRPVRVCIERPDATRRWAEVRAVQHDDGARTLLVTARDITEQRRTEELRAEVVSLVSHDLRAPLTVISGYLELLERPLDDEQRSRAVASARRSAERMGDLIEDILSATRAEELFAPASFMPVTMGPLAAEVVASLEHTSTHRLRVRAADAGQTLGEERRLRQALVNLVSNALSHTPAPGRVTVSVERSGDRVLTIVEDDGPGIPAEQRELVFERFTRLSGDRGERPGFGLGLYIVRAIAESHGGRVVIEDRPDGGPGARFVLSLPAATPADPPAEETG